MPASQRKMPGLKPDITAIAKHRSDTLQWYFTVSETDTVTDAQSDPLDLDPGVVAVKECTVLRACVLNQDQTVIGKFNTGVKTRYRHLIKNQIG